MSREFTEAMRWVLAAMLLWASFATLAAGQSGSPVLVLEHANVFTGASSDPRRNVTITIVGSRITNIESSTEGTSARVASVNRIDLAGAWVLPGLIDAHIHVMDMEEAHRMLSVGVTTGRSMLTTAYQDVRLKAR